MIDSFRAAASRSAAASFGLAAFIATVALGSPAAMADAAASAATLEEVVVTGTRAPGRTALDSPVPVDVLTAEDIGRSGAVAGELGQALEVLAPSFNFPRQSNSSAADHVRAAQLRGMSPDQVLVLVNGKRRHTSAVVELDSKVGKGTTPVDFNAIPLNAIKRIEVLRDGAGAQYGSDAIAGVINIILDDAHAGTEASLSYGENRTSFEPTHQSLRDGKTTVAQLKHGLAIGEGYFDAGAEYRHRGSTNRAGFDQGGFWISDYDSPANEALVGQRNFAPGDGESKDKDLWFNTSVPLAGGVTVHGFGTFDHRESTGAAFFRYPDSASNDISVYPHGFRPLTLGTDNDLSLSGGVEGTHGPWTLDSSVTYGANRFSYGLANSINASLGPTSPTSFHLASYVFSQLTINGDATRQLQLGSLAKPATLAIGAEYRSEHFETGAGDPASYAAGPFTDKNAGAQAGPGLQPTDVAYARRSVGALYADLSADLGERFFTESALRVERYSDFGNAVAGKLSGLYHLTPSLGLRAALSNSFRAPSLSQVSFKATSTNFGAGGALSSVLTLPVASPIARALGAQDLKAEKSQNASLGLAWAPVDAASITVDAFYIKVKDRITISEQLNGQGLTDFIQSTFGLYGVDGINFFTNAVDTRTKGVDFVSSYRFALGAGTLKLTAAYTYASTEIDGVRATPAQLAANGIDGTLFGLEERNTLTDAAPRTKGILGVEWTNARWTLTGRATRYGSAVRQFDFGPDFQPRQVYAGKTQLDLEAEAKLNSHLSLVLGGTNVLDTYPDKSSDDINYLGNFPYDVLSPIGMNGAFFYARATAKF